MSRQSVYLSSAPSVLHRVDSWCRRLGGLAPGDLPVLDHLVEDVGAATAATVVEQDDEHGDDERDDPPATAEGDPPAGAAEPAAVVHTADIHSIVVELHTGECLLRPRRLSIPAPRIGAVLCRPIL